MWLVRAVDVTCCRRHDWRAIHMWNAWDCRVRIDDEFSDFLASKHSYRSRHCCYLIWSSDVNEFCHSHSRVTVTLCACVVALVFAIGHQFLTTVLEFSFPISEDDISLPFATMSPKTPPLLEASVSPVHQGFLTVITNILGASANWIICHTLSACLGPETGSASDTVVLVSFLRSFEFWKAASLRMVRCAWND